MRRWLRTLPAYFCVMSIMVALDVHLYDRSWTYYLKYLFFLQNLSNGPPAVYPESWSLTIEEWFYILIPLAAFLLFKLTAFNRKLLLICFICLVILSVTIGRCYKIYALGISNHNDWNYFVDKSLLMRMDSIMYGVLGSWLYYYHHPVWKYKNILFYSGIILLFYPYLHHWIFGFDAFSLYGQLTVKGFSALLLLPKMSEIQSGQGKLYRLITSISTISYSIYLVHFYPFNQFGLTFLKWIGIPDQHTLLLDLVRLLAYIFWTTVFSIALYQLIEQPFMRLRDIIANPERSIMIKKTTPKEVAI